ncbi:MAG: dTMP kinase [Alphaproteobacteria bacterium]
MQGYYIALEGPDGAGKTTQMKMLVEALKLAHVPFINIREPGATDVGKKIREILLTGDANKLDATTEALLFSADRRHTILTLVRPALAAGKWVLSDRTFLTTLVFQGYGGGLSLEMLKQLTAIAVEDTRPHLQIVLDLPVNESLNRKAPQFQAGLDENRMESKGDAYHQRNRDGYHAEVAKHPDHYALVDARGTHHEVHARIVEALNTKLGLTLKPSI